MSECKTTLPIVAHTTQNKLVLVWVFHDSLIKSKTELLLREIVCHVPSKPQHKWSYFVFLLFTHIEHHLFQTKSGIQWKYCSTTSYKDSPIEWSMFMGLCHFKHKYLMDWNVFKNLAADAWTFWFMQQCILKQISQLLALLHIVLTVKIQSY